MTRRAIFGLMALLVVAACQDFEQPVGPTDLDAPAFSQQSQNDDVVPGRILARLADGADPAAVGNANGVAFARTAVNGRIAVFNGAPGNERAIAARLQGDDRVVFAEPDYLRHPTVDPRLWAFYNPGGLSVDYTRGRNKGQPVGSLLSVADADMDNVDGYFPGGAPVSIASIDTGVEMGHPEFGQATIVAGYDYYSNDSDPSDTNDHGTHTTGTMVGDAVGVAGVAGGAGLVTVHVYRVCGEQGCPSSAIASAIVAATDAGVVAMNLSLGGGSLSQAENDAILYATANDALVIASAGNDGVGSISYPAAHPDAISVAATDWLDEHAYYTQWGPGLDISAPGGELYSNTTSEAGIYSAVRGSGYAYFQGTSMAAPQVTGTAALVASATGLRGAALRDRILSTADDLGASGYDTEFGHGRVNTYRAVTGTTLSEGGPPPPPPPSGVTASFTYSCSGTVCNFDASGSTGSITSYDWSGAFAASGVTTSHDFGAAGSYDVTLTVSDGTASDSTTDTVNCSVRGKRVRCN